MHSIGIGRIRRPHLEPREQACAVAAAKSLVKSLALKARTIGLRRSA
jgi:hypothetical protein